MAIIDVVYPGGRLRTLSGVEDHGGVIVEHVSVSRSDGAVPCWEDLVLVRSLAWPDSAKVIQELPALTGPNASPWVSLPGVEVLHLLMERR